MTSEAGRRRVTRRWVVGALVTAVIVVVMSQIVIVGYAVWRNNLDMDAWRDEIREASEIEGAELVETGSRFGIQPGTNGNHCDREAWLVYRTDLTPEAIESRFDERFSSSSSDLMRTGTWASRVNGSDRVRVDFLFSFDSGQDQRCM